MGEARLVGAAHDIVTANVRWLAGYQHPRHDQPGPADALWRVFAAAVPLMAGRDSGKRAVPRSSSRPAGSRQP